MHSGQSVFTIVDGKVVSTCSYQKEGQTACCRRTIYRIRLGTTLKGQERNKYYSRARKVVIVRIRREDPKALIITATKNPTLINNYRGKKGEWREISPEELGLSPGDGERKIFLFDPPPSTWHGRVLTLEWRPRQMRDPSTTPFQKTNSASLGMTSFACHLLPFFHNLQTLNF